MGRDAQEGTVFETRGTRDVLTDVCVLWVPDGMMEGVPVRTEGMTLAAFMPLVDKADAEMRGFENFVLTTGAGSREGYRGFLFGPPQTARQKRTAWREYDTMMALPWPDILQDLHGVEGEYIQETQGGLFNATATSNTVTHKAFEDRYRLIRGGSLLTKVRRRFLQSATKYTDIHARRPVSDVVRYAYKGVDRAFDCLHETVTVPMLLTAPVRVQDFGMTSAQELPDGSLLFPATNMTTWQPCVWEDGQVFNEETGLWEREQLIVLQPPEMPAPQELGGG